MTEESIESDIEGLVELEAELSGDVGAATGQHGEGTVVGASVL